MALAPLLNLATAKLGLASTFYCQAGLLATGLLFGLLHRLPEARQAQGATEENVTKPSSLSISQLNAYHLFFHFGIFAVLAFTIY